MQIDPHADPHANPRAALQTQALQLQVGNRPLCMNFTWQAHPGECWAILGANGAGKSTLLRALAGLAAPTAGGIQLGTRDLAKVPRRERAKLLGYLPQHGVRGLGANITVAAYIALGHHPHNGALNFKNTLEKDFLLSHFYLENIANQPCHTLSGGEWQRVRLATLAAQAPQIYLLDEPTTFLDAPHAMRTLGWLRGLATEGNTVITVLHDVNLARQICTHVLGLLPGGEIVAGPIADTLNPALLSTLYAHPFTPVLTAAGWWRPTL